MSYLNQWKRVCRKIEKESILFLQNPFYHNQLGRFTQLSNLKKNKNIKVISIVHDVNELRGSFDSKYFEIEFSQMLELADILIVHNERMKQWFLGFEKLVTLALGSYGIREPAFTCSDEEEYLGTFVGN